MIHKTLSIERKDHVTIVIFNTPERSNALSIEMMNEICDFSSRLNEDEQTRVVIFTGAGKHFCTGIDLTDELRAQHYETDSRLMKIRHMKIGPEMIRRIHEIDQITIAAINGTALGGGACIASACDFRIGEQNCRVGYPEVNLAMNLSWVALPLLVHLVGPAKAKQMVILAKRETAKNLIKWGFLDEIIEDGKLLEKAKSMAQEYANQAPMAAQMVKRSVNAISSALDRAIMHMDSDQLLYSISGNDFQEGVQAFFEKRKPDFKGN
ncbi:enoyl-CoA hydratase/isomerase family protein [bacterium]|nr:enoyl-CoA hydratase/isomerase family protein [bacterium]